MISSYSLASSTKFSFEYLSSLDIGHVEQTSFTPPERQPVLDRQLELLDGLVREQFEDQRDVEASLAADQQGIGSGEDVAATDSWLKGPLSGDGRRQRGYGTGPTT